MGEPRAALAGEIASQLDLFRQRQHVRIEPRVEQYVRLDILRRAIPLGLGENAGKAAEDLQEGGNGGVVEGHVMLFHDRRYPEEDVPPLAVFKMQVLPFA